MHCPILEEARRDFLGNLSNIPELDIGEMNTQSFCHVTLYGSPGLTLISNRTIIKPTVNFIKATRTFD